MFKLIQKSHTSCVRRLALPTTGLILAGGLLLGIGNHSVGVVSAHHHLPHSTAMHALARASQSAAAKHISTIQIPALKSEALSLQQQLEQQAATWSSQHTYYDSYDGKTYNLGYEYQAIVNYPAQYLLDNAQSVADYQYAIGQFQGWLADFAAYTTNFNDSTPYNQVHATDLQRMQQESATTGQTIVISLSEQAMRVYQDGKLVNAVQIVTGMPGHASLPGNWWIESKVTNTTFTSGKQPGQEGYYPPTPIALAMQYH
ncbi:MAG: L,D-transpeptidase, partial [Ktedonobacteraceae bacterium]